MNTIQIFSKKVYRFKNPNVNALQIGGGKGQKKFEDAYFETKIGEVKVAPAWIKQDAMWDWALQDGDIMEVATVPSTTVNEMAAQAASQLADKNKAELDELASLEKMKKDELVAYAAKHFPDADDDWETMKKGDIIARVQDLWKGAPVA